MIGKQKSPISGKGSLSADPNRAIQEMMETIDSVRTIVMKETESLETANTKAFLDIQQQKLEAARKYQNGIESMLERSSEMKHVNPLLKKRLVQMQQEFSTLTAKNLEALKRMQRSTERLGEVIMGAAKTAAKSQRTVAYGETGVITGAERKAVSMGVSETA